MPGPTSTDRQGSIETSDDSDWGWWRLFHSLKGLSRHSRRQSSRVLDYWTILSHSERNAEKQYYGREPNSNEMGWTEFYAACHLIQTSGMEVTRFLEQDDNFTKAYWNLDARIVASLTATGRARDSVNGIGARETLSSDHSTWRSHIPTRQCGGDDDPPPPYEILQTDDAADPPPPYDARSPGRFRHERCLNPGRFLHFITRMFASTQLGPLYLLPPLPTNGARDEPRSSRNTPSGHGSSASPTRQNDSRQRPRLTRRAVGQTSHPRSPYPPS